MHFHDDLIAFGKVLTVAFAVGLDVFAVAIGIGVTRPIPAAGLRLSAVCAAGEISMQVLGYGLGTKAGEMFGAIATYAGFGLLALVGLLMLRGAFRASPEAKFDATSGSGLLMTALSISLDSLAVGTALPAAGIPLLPLFVTVSITTTLFTLTGLAFGARLGERYEHGAEGLAGVILILLAGFFIFEHLR